MKTKQSKQRNMFRRLNGVTMPIGRKRIRWSRNWKCLCGSSKKYKKCCMMEIDSLTASDDNATVVPIPEDIQKMSTEWLAEQKRKREEEARQKKLSEDEMKQKLSKEDMKNMVGGIENEE